MSIYSHTESAQDDDDIMWSSWSQRRP